MEDWEDKDYVLGQVRVDGLNLKQAPNFNNDNEVVLAAVKQDSWALQYASEDLKNDADVVKEAVGKVGWTLAHASTALKGDFAVVKAAVENDGRALKHASGDLQNNRDVVLAAVEQKGWALKYASKALQSDEELVIKAVKNDPLALQFVSVEVKEKNADLVKEAVKQNGLALQYASDELRKDIALVKEAVEQNGGALQFVSIDLRNDRDLVLAAVEQNGGALQFVSIDLRNDRDLVLAAVKQKGLALRYASKDLQNDDEVVKKAVKNNPLALQFASVEVKENRDVVMFAVKKNLSALQYASDELRKDNELVLAGLRYFTIHTNEQSKRVSWSEPMELVFNSKQQNELKGKGKAIEELILKVYGEKPSGYFEFDSQLFRFYVSGSNIKFYLEEDMNDNTNHVFKVPLPGGELKMKEWPREMEKLTGYSFHEAQVLGLENIMKALNTVIEPNDAKPVIESNDASSNHDITFPSRDTLIDKDITFTSRNTKVRHVLVSKALSLSTDVLKHLTFVCIDVTKIKDAENQRKKEEEDVKKERRIAVASHNNDINGLLAGFILFSITSGLLTEGKDDTPIRVVIEMLVFGCFVGAYILNSTVQMADGPSSLSWLSLFGRLLGTFGWILLYVTIILAAKDLIGDCDCAWFEVGAVILAVLVSIPLFLNYYYDPEIKWKDIAKMCGESKKLKKKRQYTLAMSSSLYD